MKIKSISVQNYKAVQSQNIDLNGASVIVTAGNNQGKTSFLKGLINRFLGEKPEIIVTKGEKKGFNTMTLTDGSKIDWSFTEKTEKLSFTTADDIKMTTGVLSAIGYKYFGTKFDIDKFINSSKSEALKQVQVLLGIDLTDVNKRYSEKYSERTDANKEVKRLQGLKKTKPEVITAPDIEEIKTRKATMVTENSQAKAKWVTDNEAHQSDAIAFNNEQDTNDTLIKSVSNSIDELEKYKGSAVGSFIDFVGIKEMFNNIPKTKEKKEVTTLVEPKYHDFADIDKEIENALLDKAKFDTYESDLKIYNDWVSEGIEAVKKVDNLKSDLDKINAEKLELVKKGNLPTEFEMTDDGLLYNGMPIDDNQISSSAKYICALKLGSLSLGKIRTMHFDASYLDNISLGEIQKWANEQDLQLLIERPALDGGKIQYQIIED